MLYEVIHPSHHTNAILWLSTSFIIAKCDLYTVVCKVLTGLAQNKFLWKNLATCRIQIGEHCARSGNQVLALQSLELDITQYWVCSSFFGFSNELRDVGHQCPGSLWAYQVGQDPSDSKANWLHVDIHLPVLLSFIWGIFIDSSKIIDNFLEVLNFNWLFLNSTGSSVTNCRFFPDIVVHYTPALL